MLQKLSLSVSLSVFWGLSVFLVCQFSALLELGRIPLIVYFAHLVAAPLFFFVCGMFLPAGLPLRRFLPFGITAAAVYTLYMLAVLAGQYGFQIALLRFDAAFGAGVAGFLTIVFHLAARLLLSAVHGGSA